ncbi:MAG: sigma-70 family RNA polymerase sigma factor, partial [Pyrinomonadaceae bacterium]
SHDFTPFVPHLSLYLALTSQRGFFVNQGLPSQLVRRKSLLITITCQKEFCEDPDGPTVERVKCYNPRDLPRQFRQRGCTMTPSPKSITQLLIEWRDGDEKALDRLMPLVYEELSRLAHRYMRRERPGHSFQTNDLVNEAYIRLVDHKGMRWQNRAHFYAVAAQAMRRILVDHARSRTAVKRGGRARMVALDEALTLPQKHVSDLLALDDALNQLAVLDPRKSKVVEMRHFGGMSVEETAETLGVSPVTVMRDWSTAKAWLFRAINSKA